MPDPPQTIQALTDALSEAQKRASEARSAKQRVSRNNRVLDAAIALYERLGRLRVWLDKNCDVERDDEWAGGMFACGDNLAKYERGWDALNAAEGIIPQWRQDHQYIEEVGGEDVLVAQSSAEKRTPATTTALRKAKDVATTTRPAPHYQGNLFGEVLGES